MTYYLSVASGSQLMTAALQPTADVGVVVDLAVKDDDQVSCFVVQRLVAVLDIDDCQPSHPEPDLGLDVTPGPVGASVQHLISHSLDHGDRGLPSALVDAGDPAHL